MMKEEHVFIKSYLTYRGRNKTTRNKLYYVVFGKYTATSYQSDDGEGLRRYFVRMYSASDEKSLRESMTFKTNEFCGLEVGSSKKATRWKLWEKERHQTFLRLFFTAKETVEFFIDNEDSNPLQAFRTIEAWRKKLTKELGYRCYWNVYMRPCGQEWGEGYGKLHLTEKSLAIVSTEKRPQTLGHWFLKSANMCKYVGSKRLIIRFAELDEPLVFETEDAREIARTLAMNMKGLPDTPVYDPFPKQYEPPISKHRKSVSNKRKPVVESSDEDDIDGLYAADAQVEAGSVTPNTPVPLSPGIMCAPLRTQGSDLVSPKQLEKCERRHKGKKGNIPPPIPINSIRNDELPPDYAEAAQAYPSANSASYPESGISDHGPEFTNGKINTNHIANGTLIPPRPNPKLDKLVISRHPEPPLGPEPSPKPVPSPRAHVTPPRPPKSPMLLRRSADTPQQPPQFQPGDSALQFMGRHGLVGHGHPQQPATPPPQTHRRAADLPPLTLPWQPGEQPATLPRRADPRQGDPLMTLPQPSRGRRPVAAPRQPRAALSRVKSKSLDCLATATQWDDDSDNDYDVNQAMMVGGGLVSLKRDKGSRKTMKKKQPTWKRPMSSYSDDDVKDDKEEIYDVSNILQHLSNRRDDRSFRISTMWYVNILSAIDKPPPMSVYGSDSPPPTYTSDTPPPLPPREPTSPAHRAVPITTDEYWSAMIICHTLRKVLVKDPPLPDTLKLSSTLRNKVCMMLYINNLGSKDWRDLADTIGLEYQAVELIEAFTAHHNHETSAEIVLRHWQFCYNKHPYDREKCPRACERAELVKILTEMHRHDIVKVITDNRS